MRQRLARALTRGLSRLSDSPPNRAAWVGSLALVSLCLYLPLLLADGVFALIRPFARRLIRLFAELSVTDVLKIPPRM